MTRPDDPDPPKGYASSPCSLHELSEAEGGLPGAVDPVQARDVARWRKAERTRLLAERATLTVAARQEAAAAIATHLDRLLPDLRGRIVSGWWPIKAELDLRPWLTTVIARGGQAALPLVTEQGHPLRFRLWHPGVKMERGFWNIPVPAEGDWVAPDIALAPVVGHDPACFRLGYGGGYFDRTLAALGAACRPIGIGLAAAQVPTIFPQPHDIPMSLVVTETGVHAPA
ncbi:MAG: 5-formyltetrahydrofolate cyclo-ligase [Proteobacteria bacterium]|nr:5-formyltetrahydrofolate cyclo-ligase [Pseudomonadota bacterium]MBS0571778.1 5-formyltetrahydrofolate cyclo-ligase [Pseudomonadota bacterium]